MTQWIRTCQECGHVQNAREPDHTKELSDSYLGSKCRKCKSEALDYGKFQRDKTTEIDNGW